MRLWTLLAVGLLAIATIPGTSAQGTGVTLSATAPEGNIPYAGTTEIPFDLTVGCVTLLEAGLTTQSPSPSASIVAENAPAFLGIENTTVAFAAGDCAGTSGSAVASGVISMTPTMEAPGMSTNEITLLATIGGGTASTTVPITIDYKMGYTWATNITFPYEMTGDSVTFDLTLTVDTNALTMVMFETVTAPLGILAAPFPYTFNDPIAMNNHTVQLTYQAPVGDWTNDTAVIKTWSHYLNDGALKTADENMTFMFTRAPGTASGGNGDGKDSPGLALPAIVALLGAALVAARRRN